MSLRLRLTLALVLVNGLVLGTLAWWISQREVDLRALQVQRENELREDLAARVMPRFRPDEIGDLRAMLSWPLWSEYEDVLVIDTRVLPLDGRKVPIGTVLNPRGRRARAADFPLAEVTQAVVRATEENRPIAVADGVAMPLSAYRPFAGPQRPWGGLYVSLPALAPPADLAWTVLIAAVASTFAAALVGTWLLGRLVLRPVERLAAGTEGFSPGQALPPLPVEGAPEVMALSRSFTAMMTRIRGFQAELESEVERATDRALSSERLAAQQERMAAMGTLAAGLAHEINSPLAGAMHGLEVLRQDDDAAKAARYAELVREALVRIQGLVQRLLLLAPGRLEEDHCRLGPVVEDLRLFLASRLEGHRFEVAGLDEEGPRLPLARGDLFPMLLNLTGNALDAVDGAHPGGGGEVRLEVEPHDGGWRLRVLDDGPGADPEVLPHLGEPFVTTKDIGEGTGLGLALAQATMGRLGGSLIWRNRDGGGFEVLLLFPAAAEEPA
jgi:signal transduction histidine kinase